MRYATWSSIGTDVSEKKNLETVLKEANLDFNVVKMPLFVKNNTDLTIPGYSAAVVEGTDRVLGIVSDTYKICQNRDAFDFVNYIDEEIEFIRAGQTYSGLVYVIAKLPQVTILGDTFTPNVIFQNGFNGGIAIKAAIVPLRIVCQNQFNLAFKEANSTVVVNHTTNMDGRLKDAREVLRATSSYMNNLNREAESLAIKKISATSVQKVLDKFFPIREDMTPRQAFQVDDRRSRFLNAYNSDDNRNFKGSAWAMINAYSDYLTHIEPSRKSSNWMENRFMSVSFNPSRVSEFYEYVTGTVA